MKKIFDQILLCAVIAVLLGAVALPPSLAHAQSRTGGRRGSAHHDARLGGEGKTETNIPISLQHNESSGHNEVRAGQKTFRIVPARHTHVDAARRIGASHIVGRNAIGLPIVRNQAVQLDKVAPIGHWQAQSAGAPANGISRLVNRNPAMGQLAVPHASPPLRNLTAGRIDGAQLTRRLPAGVGGPSIPIGGINGAAFRRKH